MKAFHNSEKLKNEVAKGVNLAKEAGTLIQVDTLFKISSWDVNTSLEDFGHYNYPEARGLPIWLAFLQDRIFMNLPRNEAVEFACSVYPAIKTGVDVEKVQWRLAILRHEKDLEAIKDNKEDSSEECRQAIKQVIQYCHEKVNGTLSESELKNLKENCENAFLKSQENAWEKKDEYHLQKKLIAHKESTYSLYACECAISTIRAIDFPCDSIRHALKLSAKISGFSAHTHDVQVYNNAIVNHYRWEAKTLLKLLSECED